MKHKLLTATLFAASLFTSSFAETEYLTIGEGTSSSGSFPYALLKRYSTTQSIYTAEEMGGTKLITSLAYNVAATGTSLSTSSMQIYMGHTRKSYFNSESSYENVSNMTLVYSGSPTLALQTGWEEFVLSTPFVYNGNDNLIVVVAKQANSFSSYPKYYYSTTVDTKCLYRQDNNTSDYGDASTSRRYSTSNTRANVRLGFQPNLINDGLYYIINSDTTVTILSCSKEKKVVTIPSTVEIDGVTYSVTSIDGTAFYNCSGLTSLTVPNSITSIGNDAFTGCTALETLTIEDGSSTLSLGYKSITSSSSDYYGLFKDCPLKKLYLGRNLSYSTHLYSYSYPTYGSPFEHHNFLSEVEIGNNVTSIGNYTFYGCTGLTSLSIPNSVTSIGENAFYGCNSLPSVSIPNSVTSIGNSAFAGCSVLTSVGISNSMTNIGDDAFMNCTALTRVDITDLEAWCRIEFPSTSSNPLTYAHHLYLNGSEIKNLVIPREITSIRNYTFSGYSSLTSVTIPNFVTSIGRYAFYNCSSLTSVDIPNSITCIESHTFSNCRGLTSVTIPNSVTNIRSYAFCFCIYEA